VCVAIGVALLAVLSIAASIQLDLIRATRSDIASVFFRALFLSSLLASVPIAVLWFLDRRERERDPAAARGGVIGVSACIEI